MTGERGQAPPWTSRLAAHGLLVAVLCAVVAVSGHHAVPMAKLLVGLGPPGASAWSTWFAWATGLGWAGIGLLLASVIVGSRAAFRALALGGVLLVLAALVALLRASDEPMISFFTATPLLTGAGIRLFTLPWRR